MASLKKWAQTKGGMVLPGEQEPMKRGEVYRVEQAQARQLISQARSQKGSLNPQSAEELYRRLVTSKKQLEGHDDNDESVRLGREITDVLSNIVGPASRGK